MKTIPAVIHATFGAGKNSSPYYYDVNITQTLCQAACCEEKPVFKPQFSVLSVEQVGDGQYLVNVHVEGAVSYIPCGCGSCATRTQNISQDFAIPVYSATALTGATITAGATNNYMAKEPCCQCSKTFVSDTPISLGVVTA